MRVPLSARAQAHVEALFRPEDVQAVVSRLEIECAHNLAPGWSQAELDRLRFAVLKLSDGDRQRFDEALALAKTDPRDLLMAAGFEQATAHTRWQPAQRSKR